MRRVLLSVALACVGALAAAPASAVAAAGAPAWTIEAVPYPTAFEAGSAYDARRKARATSSRPTTSAPSRPAAPSR